VGEVEEITAHCPVMFKDRPEVEGAADGSFSGGKNTGRWKAVTNPDLTVLDLSRKDAGVTWCVCHVAARQEVRQLVAVLGLKDARRLAPHQSALIRLRPDRDWGNCLAANR
jgi:ATPase MipZ